MFEIKLGDEVCVMGANITRVRPGGAPGTVSKVGRKFFTVAVGGGSQVFLLDTGMANDRSGNWIETPEQAALKERRALAIEALRKHGIELLLRNVLTLEQIEALAEVARGFPAP